jgi:hypothetical protein
MITGVTRIGWSNRYQWKTYRAICHECSEEIVDKRRESVNDYWCYQDKVEHQVPVLHNDLPRRDTSD